MRLSKINPILAIALMSVLGTSILSTQLSSMNSLFHTDHEKASSLHNAAEAASLPLPIDFHYKIKEKAGDAATAGNKYVEIDENFIDSDNSCEFCTYIKVKPGPKGQTGFVYATEKGLDLSNAKSITFFVMGLDGGEKLKFQIAGKTVTDKVNNNNNGNANASGLFKDKKFALATEEVTLENDWMPFSIDLTDVPKDQLTGVTHPFAIEVSKIKGEQEFYIKHIMYKAEEAELNTLTTTTAETGNATLVANATAANATDVSAADNLTDTTIENATDDAADNVTDTAPSNLTDTEDEESESDEESAPADDDIPANDTGGDEGEEAAVDNNDTATTTEPEEDTEDDDTAGENATQPSATEEENTPPIATANDDIMAYPGDQVLLDGLASSDEDGDALTYEWSQSAGPDLEITNEDTATPLVSIPSDIDEDGEAVIDLIVSDGNEESETDSVTISIDYVEPPADDQQTLTQELNPDGVQEAEWETECSDLAECLADDDENTFASAGSEGEEDLDKADLLSFGDLELEENEDAQIEQVIIQVDAAKNGETGYIKFHVDDAESFTSDLVSVTTSEQMAEYRLVLENDPVTGDEWTVDSVNSVVAGYAYGGGSSEVRVAAMKLTVIYTTTITTEASEETAEEESNEDQVSDEEESDSEQQPPTGDQEEELEEDTDEQQPEAEDEAEEEEPPEDSEETNNDTGGDEEQVDSEEEQEELETTT